MIHATPGALFPNTLLKAVGQYRADFVPWSLPTQVVQQQLPRQLEIAPQELTPAGEHPVLLVFGRQEHVRPIFLRIRGMEYLEFILAIPYLRWSTHHYPYSGPFVYLPRLYLDHWLPVILGWLCGFAKQRAHVAEAHGVYRIKSRMSHRPLIGAAFTARDAPARPRAFPRFEPLRGIFKMPLVTRFPFGCICLDFGWDLERATMQAIETQVDIEQAFLPDLPVGPFHVGGIDAQPFGAFRLDVPWTLTRPFLPSSLRERFDTAAPSGSASSVQSVSPTISLG
jgi:hypothetical protein